MGKVKIKKVATVRLTQGDGNNWTWEASGRTWRHNNGRLLEVLEASGDWSVVYGTTSLPHAVGVSEGCGLSVDPVAISKEAVMKEEADLWQAQHGAM